MAANARLHLIEPMGFRITEKQVRRAGLDYWEKLDYTVYDSYQDFWKEILERIFIWLLRKRSAFIRM